jgi:hypothetical protein
MQIIVGLICIVAPGRAFRRFSPVLVQINRRLIFIVARTRAFRRFSPALVQIILLHTMRKRYGFRISNLEIEKQIQAQESESRKWFRIGLSYFTDSDFFSIRCAAAAPPAPRAPRSFASRALLATLAQRAPHATLTTEAQAALHRLGAETRRGRE